MAAGIVTGVSENLRAGVTLRVARAAVLASVVVGTTTVAHVTGGGTPPGPLAVSGLVVVCTVALAGFLGRPASMARIITLLSGGQLLLHVALTVLVGHQRELHTYPVAGPAARHFISTPSGTHHGIHRMGSMPAPADSDPASGLIGRLSFEMDPAQLQMALAHLAAAGLLGLWLTAGERLVWRTVLLLTRPAARILARIYRSTMLLLARHALDALPEGCSDPLVGPVAHPERLRRLFLQASVVRRGPPGAFS